MLFYFFIFSNCDCLNKANKKNAEVCADVTLLPESTVRCFDFFSVNNGGQIRLHYRS